MFKKMFDNAGYKCMKTAKILFWLGSIVSTIAILVIISVLGWCDGNPLLLIGIPVCIVYCWITSLILYTIGETNAKQKPQIDENPSTSHGDVQAIWDEAEYSSVEELSDAVKIKMQDAKLPFTVAKKRYVVLFGETAEINYDGENGENCYIRVAEGSDDISDFNEYENVTETNHKNRKVTLKGNGDTFNLAIWADETYAYAVYISQDVTETDMINLIESVFG